MTARHDISPVTQILDADGHDWSWAFVVFRPIAGFPAYRVGSDGSIWSCVESKILGYRYGSVSVITDRWHRLNPRTSPARYHLSVKLCVDGKFTYRLVHTLVLEAFVGPRPKGMWGLHRDDNPLNNSIGNLYWGTPRENALDSIANGRSPLGEKCSWSKFTPEFVLGVRAAAAGGERQTSIAARLGLTQSAVHDIVRRKTWGHL